MKEARPDEVFCPIKGDICPTANSPQCLAGECDSVRNLLKRVQGAENLHPKKIHQNPYPPNNPR